MPAPLSFDEAGTPHHAEMLQCCRLFENNSARTCGRRCLPSSLHIAALIMSCTAIVTKQSMQSGRKQPRRETRQAVMRAPVRRRWLPPSWAREAATARGQSRTGAHRLQ